MILLTFTPEKQQRVCNLADVFKRQTAFLVGGAPTLKEQPLHLLEQRGVLSAAMNNAARHFRPSLWFSADHPASFEPQIIRDPGIMKFAPAGHSGTAVGDTVYSQMPNIFFYVGQGDIPLGKMFGSYVRTPWYRNTLLTSFVLLHYLGVRRIILAGSDFEFGESVYAHEDGLADHERQLNRRLYTSQIYDMKRLPSILKDAGMEVMDCSVKSKLRGIYPVITMEEAVQIALEDFPKEMTDPKMLPHGTRFAPDSFKEELGIPKLAPEEVGDGMIDIL